MLDNEQFNINNLDRLPDRNVGGPDIPYPADLRVNDRETCRNKRKTLFIDMLKGKLKGLIEEDDINTAVNNFLHNSNFVYFLEDKDSKKYIGQSRVIAQLIVDNVVKNVKNGDNLSHSLSRIRKIFNNKILRLFTTKSNDARRMTIGVIPEKKEFEEEESIVIKTCKERYDIKTDYLGTKVTMEKVYRVKTALFAELILSLENSINTSDLASGVNPSQQKNDFTLEATEKMYEDFLNLIKTDEFRVSTIKEFFQDKKDEAGNLFRLLIKFKNSVPSYIVGSDYDDKINNGHGAPVLHYFNKDNRQGYLKNNANACANILAFNAKYPSFSIDEECLKALFNFEGAFSGAKKGEEHTKELNKHSLLFGPALDVLGDKLKQIKVKDKLNGSENFRAAVDKIGSSPNNLVIFKAINLLKKLETVPAAVNDNLRTNISNAFRVFFSTILSNSVSKDDIEKIIKNIDSLEKQNEKINDLSKIGSLLATAARNIGELSSINNKTDEIIIKKLKQTDISDEKKINELKTLILEDKDGKYSNFLENYNNVLNANNLDSNDKVGLLKSFLENKDYYNSILIPDSSFQDTVDGDITKFCEKNQDIISNIDGFFDDNNHLNGCKDGFKISNFELGEKKLLAADFDDNANVQPSSKEDKAMLVKVAIAQCVIDLRAANFNVDQFTNVATRPHLRRLGLLLKLISGDNHLPIVDVLLNNDDNNEIIDSLKNFAKKNRDFLLKTAEAAGKYINKARRNSELLANLAGIKDKKNKERFKQIVSKFPKTGRKYKQQDNNNNITYAYEDGVNANAVSIESSLFSGKYMDYVKQVELFVQSKASEAEGEYFDDFLKEFSLAGVNVALSDGNIGGYFSKIEKYFTIYSFLKKKRIDVPKEYLSAFISVIVDGGINSKIFENIVALLGAINVSRGITNVQKKTIIEGVFKHITREAQVAIVNGGFTVTSFSNDKSEELDKAVFNAKSFINFIDKYGDYLQIHEEDKLLENISQGDSKLTSSSDVFKYLLLQQKCLKQECLGKLKSNCCVHYTWDVNDFDDNLNNFNGDVDVDSLVTRDIIKKDHDILKQSVVFNSFKDINSITHNIALVDDFKYNNKINVQDIDNYSLDSYVDSGQLLEKGYHVLTGSSKIAQVIKNTEPDFYKRFADACCKLSALEVKRLKEITDLFENVGRFLLYPNKDTLIGELAKAFLQKKDHNAMRIAYNAVNNNLSARYVVSLLNDFLLKDDIKQLQDESKTDATRRIILSDKINAFFGDFKSLFHRCLMAGDFGDCLAKYGRKRPQPDLASGLKQLFKRSEVVHVEKDDKEKEGKFKVLEKLNNKDLINALVGGRELEYNDADASLFKKMSFFGTVNVVEDEIFPLLEAVSNTLDKEAYEVLYEKLSREIEGLIKGYKDSGGSGERNAKEIESFVKKIDGVVKIIEFLENNSSFKDNRTITGETAAHVLFLISLDEDVLVSLPKFARDFITGIVDNLAAYKIADPERSESSSSSLVSSFFSSFFSLSSGNKPADKDLLMKDIVNLAKPVEPLKEGYETYKQYLNSMNTSCSLSCLSLIQDCNISRFKRQTANHNDEDQAMNDYLTMMEGRLRVLKNKVKQETVDGETFFLEKHAFSTVGAMNNGPLSDSERYVYKNNSGRKILIKKFEENNQGNVGRLVYYLIDKCDNLVIFKELEKTQNGFKTVKVKLLDPELYIDANNAGNNADRAIQDNAKLVQVTEDNATVLETRNIMRSSDISFEDFLNVCTKSMEFAEVFAKKGFISNDDNTIRGNIAKLIESLNSRNSSENVSCLQDAIDNFIEYRKKILFGEGIFSEKRDGLDQNLLGNANFNQVVAILNKAVEEAKEIDDNFIDFVGSSLKLVLAKAFIDEINKTTAKNLNKVYYAYNKISQSIEGFVNFLSDNSVKGKKNDANITSNIQSYIGRIKQWSGMADIESSLNNIKAQLSKDGSEEGLDVLDSAIAIPDFSEDALNFDNIIESVEKQNAEEEKEKKEAEEKEKKEAEEKEKKEAEEKEKEKKEAEEKEKKEAEEKEKKEAEEKEKKEAEEKAKYKYEDIEYTKPLEVIKKRSISMEDLPTSGGKKRTSNLLKRSILARGKGLARRKGLARKSVSAEKVVKSRKDNYSKFVSSIATTYRVPGYPDTGVTIDPLLFNKMLNKSPLSGLDQGFTRRAVKRKW